MHKPDLGLRLRNEGISSDVALFYYDVPFGTIDFLGPGQYSMMLETEHTDEVVAASFDFDDDILACLVARLPDDQREAFGKSIVGSQFPFSTRLPSPVVTAVVECHLGEVQRGAHDSFIPLVVSRIE